MVILHFGDFSKVSEVRNWVFITNTDHILPLKMKHTESIPVQAVFTVLVNMPEHGVDTHIRTHTRNKKTLAAYTAEKQPHFTDHFPMPMCLMSRLLQVILPEKGMRLVPVQTPASPVAQIHQQARM